MAKLSKVKEVHSILDRIEKINKDYILGLDKSTVTEDPQEFLEWWWNTYASDCQNCQLSETRNHVVKPDGKASARIMIIGEGPGFLEDLSQTPMVGPLELKSSPCNLCLKIKDCYSNKITNTVFTKSKPSKIVKCSPQPTPNLQMTGKFLLKSTGSIVDGILIKKWKFSYPRNNWIEYYNKLHASEPWTHESPWFITNAVLCRSTDPTGLRDTSPTTVPLDKCKKWLTFQWAAVNPDITICLGRVALAALIGAAKAKEVVPNTIIDTKFGKVIFNYHPAYFMRERGSNVKAYGFAKIASTLEKALEYISLPV